MIMRYKDLPFQPSTTVTKTKADTSARYMQVPTFPGLSIFSVSIPMNSPDATIPSRWNAACEKDPGVYPEQLQRPERAKTQNRDSQIRRKPAATTHTKT